MKRIFGSSCSLTGCANMRDFIMTGYRLWYSSTPPGKCVKDHLNLVMLHSSDFSAAMRNMEMLLKHFAKKKSEVCLE